MKECLSVHFACSGLQECVVESLLFFNCMLDAWTCDFFPPFIAYARKDLDPLKKEHLNICD